MIFDVKPAVVGHRGFGSGNGGGHRENSVAAFLAAAASGVTWVELDVRRSSDGDLVVWHDPRTPAGQPLVTRTASQLAGAGIVRLTDVLAALPPTVGVNMDVKTVLEDATDPPGRRTHALVAEALGAHLGTRSFFVSSFDPSVPLFLRDRAALGDVAIGLITSENLAPDHGIAAAANLGLDAVCLHVGALGPGGDWTNAAHLVDAAHRTGLEVMTWTATPAQAARAAVAGVDAVCVDDIPGVQAALAAWRPAASGPAPGG